MHEEALYYNAVAVALHGDHGALRKAAQYGTWKKAYHMLLMGERPVPVAEEAWDPLEKFGVGLLLPNDPAYPQFLREIHRAPFGIYVRGNVGSLCAAVPLEHARTIAIVGTRRATPDGRRLATIFGRELARAGFTIVSGLAIGIDAAAHEGALEAHGVCVAVLPNGIDHIYPHTNARLGEKIIATGGAVVSEYPPGELTRKYRFLERNRIISGLARGTLVIEAPESSGSLATADFALEENRDVFVIPGNIAAPNFRGANALIRQGATLVTKPEEIFEAYGVQWPQKKIGAADGGTPEEMLILHALRAASRALEVDKIITVTKLEPRIVNRTLSFLVMKGFVKESGNGYILETNL